MRLIKSIHLMYHNLIKEGTDDGNDGGYGRICHEASKK